MYKNILVPIAFDEEHDPAGALETARYLVDEGGHITLLHVMDSVPAYVASQIPQSVREEARKQVLEKMQARLQDMPNSTVQVVDGHAGTTILEFAEDNQIDLIVIRSHRPALEDYFLGSTAARVVRHATCSVHVIR